MHKPQRCD